MLLEHDRRERVDPVEDRDPGDDDPAAAPGIWTALSPTIRFTTVFALALVLLVLTYLVFVATEPGQRLENLALRGAELRSDVERETALDRLSFVSVALFAIAIVAVLAVGFLRHRERLAFVAAGVMGVSVVVSEILKDLLPRPALVEGPAWILRNSFPSGSAAVATAIAVGALLVAPDRLRWAVLLVGVALVALVGEAVQTTGWHRLSDSVGAVFIVVATAAAGLALLARAGLVVPSDAARIDHRFRAAILLVAAATVTIGAILLLVLAAFPLLSAPSGARSSIVQTALPLVGVGVTALAIVLFARMIEPYSLGARPQEDRGPA